MSRLPHTTRPVQVWADVDLGIADLVIYLNTVPGIRTFASCQGTIGEGGPAPYRAHVMAQWSEDAIKRLLADGFDIEIIGNDWGHVYPTAYTDTHLRQCPQPQS